MSGTDNTRPYEVQSRDWTEPGYVSHGCTKRRGRSSKWKPSRTSPVWLEVMVSDGALATKDRLELAQAKLPHRVVPQSGLPVRLQVKRRPNTTTAKVMELLREVFGQEVELLPKERRRDTVYLECNGRVCHRMLRHYGGENYVHGHAGDERQRRNRQRRRREKAALYQAQYKLVDEFDILPIREDKKTIVWDLC